jgi:hypothetical protein
MNKSMKLIAGYTTENQVTYSLMKRGCKGGNGLSAYLSRSFALGKNGLRDSNCFLRDCLTEEEIRGIRGFADKVFLESYVF